MNKSENVQEDPEQSKVEVLSFVNRRLKEMLVNLLLKRMRSEILSNRMQIQVLFEERRTPSESH